MDDVGTFHRFARYYDLAMPDADRKHLEQGLSLADREILSVVDLAGGTGRGLRAIEGIDGRNGRSVRNGIVLDAADGMVRRARSHGHAAIRGDAGNVPIAEGAVDAVVVLDALHHLLDRQGTIAESARILAPGGVLLVQEFDPTTRRGRALVAVEHLVGFDSSFDPPGVLAQHMRRTGLDPVVVDHGFSSVLAGVKRDDRPTRAESGT